MYYLAAVLDGNIFVNMIVVGVAETFGGLLSGLMLTKMKDTTAFLIFNMLNLVFNSMFYFMPNEILKYFCLAMSVTGAVS